MNTRFLLERGDEVTHYNRGKLDLYPRAPEVRQIHGNHTDCAAFERQIAEAGRALERKNAGRIARRKRINGCHRSYACATLGPLRAALHERQNLREPAAGRYTAGDLYHA